jgi:hypothetical protein
MCCATSKAATVKPSTAVNELRDQFESDNDYFQEYVLGWQIVADDFLTEFEHDQLECDGEIRWPAKEIRYSIFG